MGPLRDEVSACHKPKPRWTRDRLPRALILFSVLGPIGVSLVLGVAGWLTAGWPGAVAGLGVGGLIVVTVVVGAAVWARQIGHYLEPADAFELAPRPPGFRRLCDWTYRRTLGPQP
jgi:hypothetical protein